MPGSADNRGEQSPRVFQDGSTGRWSDGLTGDARREQAVVDLLTRAGERLRPDQAARDRMRATILAGLRAQAADDDVAKEAAGTTSGDGPNDATTVGRVLAPGRRRRSVVATMHGRLLVSAAAALCLLVALSGMSLVLARDALPGDALYGIKRSAESAQLGLTFGDEARGFKHLEFASARLDEIEELQARSGGTAAAQDAGRYLTALQAFDDDAAAGARLLAGTATDRADNQLATVQAWAGQQRDRFVAAALPAQAAARAAASVALLDRIIGRMVALRSRLACQDVTAATADELGPLPATGVCAPVARPAAPGSAPGGNGQPGPTGSAPPGPAVQVPGGQLPATVSGSGLTAVPPLPGTPGVSTSAGVATTSLPGITLPLPPPPSISLPPLHGLKMG
jgi:hypothetical protein